MNEDTIADLKQFIASTVSQHVSGLQTDIRSLQADMRSLQTDVRLLQTDVQSLKVDVRRVDTKIDDLSVFVAEALDASNDAAGERLDGHERRIARLEAGASVANSS